MPSKHIKIPDPISLIDPDTDAPLADVDPVTFVQWFRKAVAADPRWYATADAMESKQAIMESFKFAASGDGVAQIAVEDHKMLLDVIAAPRHFVGTGQERAGFAHWHPLVTDQFLRFIRAIRSATDVRPKDDKEKEKPAE